MKNLLLKILQHFTYFRKVQILSIFTYVTQPHWMSSTKFCINNMLFIWLMWTFFLLNDMIFSYELSTKYLSITCSNHFVYAEAMRCYFSWDSESIIMKMWNNMLLKQTVMSLVMSERWDCNISMDRTTFILVWERASS